MDLLCFVLMESTGKFSFILPLQGYKPFDPEMPKIEGPGYYDPGITEIPADKIIQFFEFVMNKGDEITIVQYSPNGLDTKNYLVAGEFDKKMRREKAKKEYEYEHAIP